MCEDDGPSRQLWISGSVEKVLAKERCRKSPGCDHIGLPPTRRRGRVTPLRAGRRADPDRRGLYAEGLALAGIAAEFGTPAGHASTRRRFAARNDQALRFPGRGGDRGRYSPCVDGNLLQTVGVWWPRSFGAASLLRIGAGGRSCSRRAPQMSWRERGERCCWGGGGPGSGRRGGSSRPAGYVPGGRACRDAGGVLSRCGGFPGGPRSPTGRGCSTW